MATSAIVVGAGPAGLASAACLKMRRLEVTVLEAGAALGEAWRHHYRRLRLHTVKQQSGLPGFPFPPAVPRYPSRADVVQYLESYAAHFDIVPRVGERVRRISADGGALVVESEGGPRRSADVVVVAVGRNRVPNADRLPGQEAFAGRTVLARDYEDGAPFAGQRVLVVGAGNTGAEIALDLAEHGAKPTLSVRTPVNVVPRDFLGMPTQLTSIRLRGLPIALGDRIGRGVSRLAFGDLARFGLVRPELGPLSSIKRRGRIPIIDVGTVAAIKSGAVTVKPGVERVTEAGARFADGSAEPFDALVLATGYRPMLAEIVDVPGALRDDGFPKDWRGGGAHPGLYFVGFEDVATGLLREITRQAQAVAADVEPPPLLIRV